MSVKDFPPRPHGVELDSAEMLGWLDRLRNRQNINDLLNQSTVSSADETYLFSVSSNAVKKTTISSIGTAVAAITLGTQVASTSGTSIDFTGIPSGVKRITIMFSGVSTNGISGLLIQIGDSGGIETSGYLGACGNGGTPTLYTTGFGIDLFSAAGVLHGQYILSLENAAAFRWACSGIVGRSDSSANALISTAGVKATSAELDRVRITTVNGSDAFDAGLINISYE